MLVNVIITLALVVGFMLVRALLLTVKFRSEEDYLIRCPKCDGDVYRTQRHFGQRFVGYLLAARLRNYRCTDCQFRGMLHVRRSG